MHEELSGRFLDNTIIICKFKIYECLVYKMETFENCKEVKHIMIVITEYDFLSYVTFDQQLKITFGKYSAPPLQKNPLAPFYSLPPKNSKKGKGGPFAFC